jgi:hypothetical protein
MLELGIFLCPIHEKGMNSLNNINPPKSALLQPTTGLKGGYPNPNLVQPFSGGNTSPNIVNHPSSLSLKGPQGAPQTILGGSLPGPLGGIQSLVNRMGGIEGIIAMVQRIKQFYEIYVQVRPIFGMISGIFAQKNTENAKTKEDTRNTPKRKHKKIKTRSRNRASIRKKGRRQKGT